MPNRPLRNWPWQPCRDFVQSYFVFVCSPWQISEEKKETWNFDFKVFCTENSRRRGCFLCMYLCVRACVLVFNWHIFRPRFNSSALWIDLSFIATPLQSAAGSLSPKYSQHIDEFHIQPRSQLAPYSVCRVPFFLTHYRQGRWPRASGSCTRADVLALRGLMTSRSTSYCLLRCLGVICLLMGAKCDKDCHISLATK